MDYKLLSYRDYLNFFFNNPELRIYTNDTDDGDIYLAMMTEVEKPILGRENQNKNSFLDLECPEDLYEEENVYDPIDISWQLFANGNINGINCMICNPNVDEFYTNETFQKFQSTVLVIPTFFFLLLVDKEIFLEKISWKEIKNTRIIRDLEAKEDYNLEEMNSSPDFSPFEKLGKKLNDKEIKYPFDEKFIEPELFLSIIKEYPPEINSEDDFTLDFFDDLND